METRISPATRASTSGFTTASEPISQMTGIADKESGGASLVEDSSKLDVLLIHEDLPAGLRGKHVIDQVAAKLDPKTEFAIHLWRFDLLDEPSLRHQAMADATQASIIILAINGCAQLPTSICAWLKQWLQGRRPAPCAIVVSLDAKARNHSHPALCYVRSVANPAGVDLFPHYADTPDVAWDWSAGKRWQADSAPETQFMFHPQPTAGWGINE